MRTGEAPRAPRVAARAIAIAARRASSPSGRDCAHTGPARRGPSRASPSPRSRSRRRRGPAPRAPSGCNEGPAGSPARAGPAVRRHRRHRRRRGHGAASRRAHPRSRGRCGGTPPSSDIRHPHRSRRNRGRPRSRRAVSRPAAAQSRVAPRAPRTFRGAPTCRACPHRCCRRGIRTGRASARGRRPRSAVACSIRRRNQNRFASRFARAPRGDRSRIPRRCDSSAPVASKGWPPSAAAPATASDWRSSSRRPGS